MCDGYSSIAMQVGGALNSAAGAYFGAKGEKRQLERSADVADLNARLSNLSAKDALRRGQREEQASMLESTRTHDKAVTAYAANGIALDSQTAIQVLTSSDVLGKIDANTINANAARAAWGYRMEGVQYKNEALTSRAAASAISPFQRLQTSLINSAGNISDSYVRLKKAGAFEKEPKAGKTGRGTGK